MDQEDWAEASPGLVHLFIMVTILAQIQPTGLNAIPGLSPYTKYKYPFVLNMFIWASLVKHTKMSGSENDTRGQPKCWDGYGPGPDYPY